MAGRKRAQGGLVDKMLSAVGLARTASLPRPRASVYHGATVNRTTVDFIASRVSADAASLQDLRTLRNRARKLERDNGWARRYVDLVEENVVGPDGFGLQVDTSSDDDAAGGATAPEPEIGVDGRGVYVDEAPPTLGETVEAAWLDFTTRAHCSIDGRHSFTDLESLTARRWLGADGEAVLQILPGRGKYGVQFEPLDADLLDETFHRVGNDRDNEIRAGVEVDGSGRPVAYWLWNRHPDDVLPSGRRGGRRRVPAEFIVHVYDAERPGQTRGVTRFAPVMQDLHRLGAMQEATLILQHVAACQGGWLVPKDDETAPLLTPEQQAAGQTDVSIEAEPATLRTVPHGYTVEGFEPSMPGEQYVPFTQDVKHSTAAGFGVSYMSLTGDLKGTSFSSGRMGLGPERRRWRRKQVQLRDSFHAPLFRAWLRYASLSGALPLTPEQLVEVQAAAEWLLPGWDYVDPEKDANASITEVANTMNSLTAILAAKGRDFATVARQRAREIRLLRRLGLPEQTTLGATSAPAPDPAPGAPVPD